ncbi:type II toxin-antitoxin system RelE/ParE family toxin [Paenibacillus profundus]|uniref:Type II toxin-antitoxin system RelE/ParE family toxin n=1 Tax=Paenibacillus profundus TaxID=1173085 RepID=A0ABS8YPC8_9BACL|nr:type II toxin-antitoxin system RelE/ParE family toxin [Paenibacillus profundus]MCE5172313.1 type II toxin-antitoxin system RelE/ParE family toxin [Paenibacillus profundus]
MNSNFKVDFSSEAKKYLKKLDKPTAKKIISAIEALRDDPYNTTHTKKMKGYEGEFYRLRVGSYRIIYEILNGKLLILIVKVGSRGDIYK